MGQSTQYSSSLHNPSVASEHLFQKYVHPQMELEWNGIRICNSVYQPPPEIAFNPGISEHQISIQLTKQDYLKRRFNGEKWQSASTSPGVLTFFPAHREVEFLWNAEVEILSIYLPPALLKQAAVESYNDAPQTIELIDRFAIRDPFLEQLTYTFKVELAQNRLTDRLYLESLQNSLLGYLLRHHCSIAMSPAQVSGGLIKSKLQLVVDYIHSHLAEDISLAELANVAQVSIHHFGKLFKQSTGITPHQYVLRCRIEQAKKLLAANQLSLVEITHLVGFYDQSHFINVFRQHTNLTPKQYQSKL